MAAGSPFLIVVGMLVLAGLGVLARLYWLRGPLVGTWVALVCYLASVVVSGV